MKKFIFILFLSCLGTGLWAQSDKNRPHLSPEEFRAKQEAYITQKADLTKQEAEKFFPAFFELQDKKKELNDKMTRLRKKGKDKDTSEKEYEKIIEEISDLRVKSSELEKDYYKRFQKILSSRKVYMVQNAEINFQRELLKGANQRPPTTNSDNSPNRQKRR